MKATPSPGILGMRPSMVLTLGTLVLCAPSPAQDAAALLAGSHVFGAAPLLVVRLEMRISEGGTEKTREVELSLDRRGGRLRSFSRITSPAFLAEMKFLKLSEPGKPDAQWVKTSNGIRRLGDSGGGESVFGSHFTVEDFGTITAEGFILTLDPALDSPAETAITARPRGKAGYATRTIWVGRASGLVTRMEYRNATGTPLRRYRILSTEGTGRDAHPLEAVMEDLNTGGSTTIKVLSFITPGSLPERLFNAGSL